MKMLNRAEKYLKIKFMVGKVSRNLLISFERYVIIKKLSKQL